MYIITGAVFLAIVLTIAYDKLTEPKERKENLWK